MKLKRTAIKPDPVPGGEPKLEDLPAEWVKEDNEIEGRKPDLAETEEDPSE